MEIIILDKKFTINEGNLEGIFLAKNFINLDNIYILQNISGQHATGQDTNFKIIEQNSINFIYEYTLIKSNIKDMFPDKITNAPFSSQVMNYVVTSKNTLLGFNSDDIYNGVTMLFTALNLYPKDTFFYKKIGTNWVEIYIPIDITNDNSDEYVAPKNILINLGNNIINFKSNDSKGWKCQELFNLINKQGINTCTGLKYSAVENNYIPIF